MEYTPAFTIKEADMIRYCKHCEQARVITHNWKDGLWECSKCGHAWSAAPRIKGIVVTHTRIKGIVTERRETQK